MPKPFYFDGIFSGRRSNHSDLRDAVDSSALLHAGLRCSFRSLLFGLFARSRGSNSPGDPSTPRLARERHFPHKIWPLQTCTARRSTAPQHRHCSNFRPQCLPSPNLSVVKLAPIDVLTLQGCSAQRDQQALRGKNQQSCRSFSRAEQRHRDLVLAPAETFGQSRCHWTLPFAGHTHCRPAHRHVCEAQNVLALGSLLTEVCPRNESMTNAADFARKKLLLETPSAHQVVSGCFCIIDRPARAATEVSGMRGSRPSEL